ncbi:hypothetical protein CYMTET_28207 [Cymbomonas tetramitiformis]|uniref:Uncharacterized protein n=1 Tax=Cymbomonas tetramitiformis TaxID=36881 RepID=A0AAE0KW55_9CHLO|nr:hypothetical protein CYMTET_28207 [Cymbomonas tetramitiformis]
MPTEEFPGGIDLVPVRHDVPSMTLDPLISAVACSFEPVAESFVEPAEACEHLSILRRVPGGLGGGRTEPAQSTSERSFVETSCGASTDRPRQVMRCGAPPPGLRPNLLLLACFLGLLSFSCAGATGLGGASGGGMPAEGAQPTAVPPPDYWRPEGHYGSGHNPGHGWTWYPGPSYPQVVVPDWAPPSPGGAPPSPDYEPEEVEQPTLNGDHHVLRSWWWFLH